MTEEIDQLPRISRVRKQGIKQWISWSTTTPSLLDKDVSSEAILDAMIEHPILVNRPIVCTPKGVRLCGPSEAVCSTAYRSARSIKKAANCSSIVTAAVLAELNLAFEEVNPRGAKTHRSMWHRRIFSHKFLREIPRDCAILEIAQSLRRSASRMARSASSMLPRNPRNERCLGLS